MNWHFYLPVLSALLLIQLEDAYPIVKCRYCKQCEQSFNSTTGNQTDPISDLDETVALINFIIDPNNTLNLTIREKSFFVRSKRESFIQRKPCPKSFQWELFLIPASILAIPLVLICFFLCACLCGKKEERARVPKVWYTKKVRKRRSTADDLYYAEDYVKRRDSQKTRFNTKVTIIERRQSAITVKSVNSDEKSTDI